MNNHLSYCGLVNARISASGKDLPVPDIFHGCNGKKLITLAKTEIIYPKNLGTL
jgi:hypothetical protein